MTSGLGYAALMVEGTQRLYSIDLTNGRATNLGAVGIPLSGLAVGQTTLR